MREYHKWEKEVVNHPIINNLIDILIGDEPSAELGSNLKEIEVPARLQEQFESAKQEELNEIMQESTTEQS